MSRGISLSSVQVSAQGANFGSSLQQGVESIESHLDTPDTSLLIEFKAGFIIKKVIDILFPVIVII